MTEHAPELTVAVGDYDHTRDLATGRVQAEGLALRCVNVETPEELFERFLHGGEWDAAEMSLAVCCTLRARDDERFLAIPVFPARSFRHGAIYTQLGGPTSPGELAGARIGIPVWTQTAGVYARGILADRYGLRLEDVTWIQAGVDAPGRVEPVALDLGAFEVIAAPERSLDDLLLSGDVDAVISARPPASIERGDRRVRRLFASPEAEEIAYFRATGVFPIMHVLALRRAAHEAHPGGARSLFDAFGEAKRRSLRRVSATTVPTLPLPWAATHARAARELIGDDFWPYGVEPNRPALEAFMGYAAQQGLTDRCLIPDELFAPEFATRQPL